MPAQTREAALLPLTYRAADNSMDVCWTTGIRRRAYDWFNDQVYDEELEVSRSAVDMTRFEAGTVQVIDSHRTQDGIDAILGVATRGWIENGEGMARIAFSKDPAKAGKVGDIVDGIIRAMSFGYSARCRCTGPSCGLLWRSPSALSAQTTKPARAPKRLNTPDLSRRSVRPANSSSGPKWPTL